MEPRNPDFAAAVRASFARQGMMELLAARLVAVAPGRRRSRRRSGARVSQQHGFAHAGLAWTLGDSAAGYSALSLLGPGEEVLTVEMKINLLAPARGARLSAEGRVIRAGKRLLVVGAEVHAEAAAEGAPRRTHVATLIGTMIAAAVPQA